MFNEPHILKCNPELFSQSWLGQKPFEYRRNDRNFYEGDELIIREYDSSRKGDAPYSGRYVRAIVEKIWGAGWSEIPDLPEDYIIMKIKIIDHQNCHGMMVNWRYND